MAFTDQLKGRKGLVFLGGGALALVGFLYWRHKQASAAAAGPADTTGTDTGSTDGTGDYTDTSGYGDYFGGGGGGGFFGPPPVDGGTGGPGPGSFTSNAQWAQYAEQQLSGVVDEATLSAALGKYLTGQPMTDAQKSLTDQAVAIAGYPPVSGPGGFPPAMHTTGGGGGGQGGRKYITASGDKDLNQTAVTHGLTEQRLIDLNPGLKHFEGTGKHIPRGTRVRIQ